MCILKLPVWQHQNDLQTSVRCGMKKAWDDCTQMIRRMPAWWTSEHSPDKTSGTELNCLSWVLLAMIRRRWDCAAVQDGRHEKEDRVFRQKSSWTNPSGTNYFSTALTMNWVILPSTETKRIQGGIDGGMLFQESLGSKICRWILCAGWNVHSYRPLCRSFRV